MATLRSRARQHRKSVAAEVATLLQEDVPTAKEKKARKQFLAKALRLRSHKPVSAGPFPSSEEMLREDRER